MNREALVQAILDLQHDRAHRVEDPDLAHALGEHLKPYIDLLDQAGAQGDSPAEATEDLLPSTAAGKGSGRRQRKGHKQQGPPSDINELPPRDQARWIFLDRFIPLEKHEEILGIAFAPDYFEAHETAFEKSFSEMLQLPRFAAALAKNKLESLQRYFASYVLLFRSPHITTTDQTAVKVSIESLRQRFPDYFYKRSKKPNWFERHPFYTESIDQPHWALFSLDYLNCTLWDPDKRVSSYGNRWKALELDVRPKTLLEEVYDRIICGQALEEKLFPSNVNYLTGTEYRNSEKGAPRLTYVVQQEEKMGIHGKINKPHWHWKKRLWPGVLPSLIMS